MAQSQAPSREWTPRQFKKRDSGNPKRSKHEKKKDGAGVRNSRKAIRAYSLGEEIANSITHGVGALLAIAAIPLCVVAAVRSGGGLHLLAALAYSIFMLLEYVMSTLYHAIAAEKAKRVFKVLDHSFIYLFIAASYSPYCLVTLVDCHGVVLFAFVWAVAIIGVIAESFWVVWFIPQLWALLPAPGFWLLLAGGLCYSIGCIFYVLKKVPYMHSIFHVWILAGSVCQFLSICLFVL